MPRVRESGVHVRLLARTCLCVYVCVLVCLFVGVIRVYVCMSVNDAARKTDRDGNCRSENTRVGNEGPRKARQSRDGQAKRDTEAETDRQGQLLWLFRACAQ